MHEVAQRDARLHSARESHEHALRHVERHHPGGGGECDKARSGGERDADGKARVTVAARADGVRQQHAVQPRVNDAIAGTQRHAAAIADEIGKRVVRHDVNRLGVRRRVAERLHDEVGGETQAREVLQLVARHRPGGILRSHARHARLAVRPRQNALDTARLSNHLLSERVLRLSLGRGWWRGFAEEPGILRHAQGSACLRGESSSDDERDAASGTNFVEYHVSFELEVRDDVVRAVRFDDALVRENVDDIAVLDVAHIALDRKRARVLERVEEDGRDLPTKHDTSGALVWHVGDVFSHEPENRVRR
mmetsp:Transcript_5991/g.15458  ORF Transcript_5991/g.15458 Transcript_5991/m.15458 type:complete len:307 (+) Transcript_5991:1025-1945(+)